MKNHLFVRFVIAFVLSVASIASPVLAGKKENQAARQMAAQQRAARQALKRAANMAQRMQTAQRAQMAAQRMQRPMQSRQAGLMAVSAPVVQGGGRKNKRGKAVRRGANATDENSEPQVNDNNTVTAQIADSPPLSQSRREVSDAAAKIDAMVLARLAEAKQKPNPPATDEQFVRRIYLDIAGRIPTADEATAFLTSNTPGKRAELIDTLLKSDGYASQMFDWQADMLRVKDKVTKEGPAYAYEEWLKDRIAANKPWNETVYQMMTAEGSLSTNGATGYLLRDPGMPLDNLSNTLTTFLGANIACAQCHNHPLASWTQRQFYEMAGFFGDVNTNVVKANGLVKKVIKQSPQFDDNDKKILQRLATANNASVRVMPGRNLTFPQDYKYEDAKPGAIVHPALFTWEAEDKNSPAYAVDAAKAVNKRQAFAAWLTHADNPRFAVAIANRLWRKDFGLAVQEPITDLDDLSKASNPALIVHLGAEMKRMNFDLREFQRVLFNTQTYQRQASVTPDLANGPYLFPGPVLRRMTADQAWDSVLTLAVGTDLDRYKLKRAAALQPFVMQGQELTAKTLEAKALEIRKTNPQLKGMAGGYVAEDGRAAPPRFAGMILARASELEQPAKESSFLRMFGQSDRSVADDSSREGGIPQVLMMMNGDVQNVIGNRTAQALKSAAKFSSPEQQVESLYLSFLGRRPTALEKGKVLRALQSGTSLADLTWVLFNTREFIFVQ